MPPTSDTALDRRLDAASSRPLAVAFSGGGDSLALLLLARSWGERTGRPVVALTVDHGLHPDSGGWTSAAEQAARRLGVAWRGLAWTGEKPSTGLPAAARRARHRLLARAAHEIGARVILVGHTADDRRESDLIRRHTPGLGHLREWSPSPAWPDGRGVFLLRPLLNARRAELRAELSDLGLSWLEDPANIDMHYARSRARVALEAVASPDSSAAPDLGDEALRTLALSVVATLDGRLCVSRDRLQDQPPPTLRRFIGAALLCAGGGDRPPRGDRLDALIERLLRPDPFVATLSGARIASKACAVEFAREASAASRKPADGGTEPIMALGPSPIVLDGRFELQSTSPGVSAALLAGRIGRLGRKDIPGYVSAHARGGLPALIDAMGSVSLPAPFGVGPGRARALAGARLLAACGVMQRECEL